MINTRDDGNGVVVKCHAGCTADAIVAALNLRLADLFDEPHASGSNGSNGSKPVIVATYDYVDETGVLLWQKLRYVPKRFVQRRPDGRGGWIWKDVLAGIDRPLVLYRLPELLASDGPVYLCEGEKDTDAMRRAGVTATTWTEGASKGKPKWRREYTKLLAGRDVIIVRHRDEAGETTAAALAGLLDGTAASVRIVEAAEGNDAHDHLSAGHTIDQLVPVEDGDASDGDDPVLSWAPVDLTAFLDGTHVTPEPLLMPRTDGICLLYPGLTHSMHGESESGKSLVMQAESVRVLNSGGRVLFIDFESDPASIVGRLLDLGADRAALAPAAGRFVYLQPEVDMRSSAAEAAVWLQVLSTRFDLAVIDGVTVSLGVLGGVTKDNDNVTQWARLLPDRIARKTGAAVVSIDHVTKDPETRGRFAIGGQAKMSALTGAAYIVEATEALGRGLRGVVTLRVGKDRPGYIRARAGDWRARDRTQEVARVVVDSTGDETRVSVEPPADAGEFRPTVLMERISKWLETNGPAGVNEIRKQVTGKAAGKDEALRVLVQEGYVTITAGPNNSKLHHSTRVFRAVTDDSSAGTHPGSENSENPVGECVPPYTTGRGTHPQSASGTHRGHTGDAGTHPAPNDISGTDPLPADTPAPVGRTTECADGCKVRPGSLSGYVAHVAPCPHTTPMCTPECTADGWRAVHAADCPTYDARNERHHAARKQAVQSDTCPDCSGPLNRRSQVASCAHRHHGHYDNGAVA